MLVMLVSVFKKYMSLKEFETSVVIGPADRRVENYLESYIARYGERFAKGRIMRNRDDSIDSDKVIPFADRKALTFLAGLAPEISGLAQRKDVYVGAGDIVLNAMNDRIRHHLGRLAAVMNGMDPDHFRIKPIDWERPATYAPYQRSSGQSEALVSSSVIFPEIKLDTGVRCSYDFSRSADSEFVSIDICGIAYNFNADGSEA